MNDAKHPALHAAAIAANRAAWEAWTPDHVDAPGYDIASFRAGREPLDPISRAGVGDVRGRTLLHLQCHFGLDTLAWQRLGATATGVDFAPTAIAAARALAADTGLPATFVCSDLYALPERLAGTFDVVFTSVGVLGWLPDLEAWGRIVARYLAPGGRFFLFEGHPTMFMFDELPPAGMRLRYPYFARQPIVEANTGSYAAPDSGTRTTTHSFLHPLADILGALLRAGLTLTAFDEYPLLRWPGLPWMTRRDEWFWELPREYGDVPLMFSVAATR